MYTFSISSKLKQKPPICFVSGPQLGFNKIVYWANNEEYNFKRRERIVYETIPSN